MHEKLETMLFSKKWFVVMNFILAGICLLCNDTSGYICCGILIGFGFYFWIRNMKVEKDSGYISDKYAKIFLPLFVFGSLLACFLITKGSMNLYAQVQQDDIREQVASGIPAKVEAFCVNVVVVLKKSDGSFIKTFFRCPE